MARSLRRVGAIVLAVMAAALAAACSGGSSPPTPAPSVQSPVGSSGGSSGVPPSAVSSGPGAVAAAINLTAADMPGFTGTPHQVSAADRRNSDRLARCAGGTPPSAALADVYSPDFSKGNGTLLVDSDVTVMPSTSDVARDVASLRSGRAESCFRRLIGQELAQQLGGVKVSGLRVDRISSPAPGTDAAFGFRITLTITRAGQSTPLFSDLRGFAVGNVEVSLTTFGTGQPFPESDALRLFSLLVQRAGSR